ncbi:hypothetical protein [Phenylobacterium sp.]|uniref:hypothetical protein n=1 Tax=Phenylobacterium sp. TaxID=1871053 RepID=UPI0035B1BACC
MDIDVVRERAARAIIPLKAATAETSAPKDLLFTAHRLISSRDLPPYHLVYFLLVDLLGFRNLGRFEKLAWSVPVDYAGRAYLFEHRKMGFGLFGERGDYAAADAREISRRLLKGMKAAEPYFTWRAAQAIAASHVNVTNRATELFERYQYFAAAYRAKRDEAEARKDEQIRTDLPNGGWTVEMPVWKLRTETKWLALAAIEGFFSWTEHAFVLLAILRGQARTGDAVGRLALADWAAKFQAALDITEPTTKRFYDDLVVIRQQLRNLVAHGAFGKDGDAFRMHSAAGAVPVRVIGKRGAPAYRFGYGVTFVEDAAITRLAAFVDHLWDGDRRAAWIYIQDWQLPLILTHAADGTYANAMASPEAMEAYARALAEEMDRNANMDW